MTSKTQLLICPKIELEMGIAKHYSFTTCLKDDTLCYYSLSHISNKKYCISRVRHFCKYHSLYIRHKSNCVNFWRWATILKLNKKWWRRKVFMQRQKCIKRRSYCCRGKMQIAKCKLTIAYIETTVPRLDIILANNLFKWMYQNERNLTTFQHFHNAEHCKLLKYLSYHLSLVILLNVFSNLTNIS